jgi:hypothetical protein
VVENSLQWDKRMPTREDHGCKRHGTVMLSSTKTKDTVMSPVKMYTLECGYRSFLFRTGDQMHGNIEGDNKSLTAAHFELEHSAPPLVLVGKAMVMMSWEAFAEWYVHYRDKIIYDMMQDNEDRLFAFLETNLGDVGKLIRDKLGEDYFELRELDLLLEIFKITRAQPEQPPKQEQQVGDMFTVDKMTFKEQEKTIGSEKRFKQEVTIGNENLTAADKVTNTELKDLKSALKSDPESDIKKPDLKSDLQSDLRSSKPVEVAEELVRGDKLGEPVLVDIPRADPEQEAAEDNAGRAGNALEEDKVDKKEETVT